MGFSHIIGHERIAKNLQKALSNKSISHSYLFEGPKSIGKNMVAEAFAKTLLCKAGGTRPCNKCISCVQFDSGNHPDFHIERPDGETFKKEQIEELQKSIQMLPYEGNRKVYILEDIHKMTESAQNSFLKTLEEPPLYAVIIMTVINSYSLLPTIVSRTQIIRFTPVENKIIEDVLISKYNKSLEEARFIASFSKGVIGKAINLSESDKFKSIREETISILDKVINSDRLKIYSLSSFFEENKEDIDDILDMVLIWFRDLLVFKETSKEMLLVNSDFFHLISKHSSKLSKNKIHDIIKVVEETKSNIASRVNYQLSIEVMLMEIQEV